MTLKLYGIPNCDKVRAARRWLDQQGKEYEFVDLRNPGINQQTLLTWSNQVGWESLLNRRSTSWRSLDDTDKTNLNENSACLLMQQNPTLIKRPVLSHSDAILLDFSASEYEKLFSQE